MQRRNTTKHSSGRGIEAMTDRFALLAGGVRKT
jgi:hypothetical protein